MRNAARPAAITILAALVLHVSDLSAQVGRPPRSQDGGGGSIERRPTPAPPAANKPAAGPKLNDAQVATIALTAHQIDIERGKLAQKKARSPAVKQFADQMVNDHSQGQKAFQDLDARLKVKLEDSDVTKDLKSKAADKLLLLKQLSGSDFDKAYVDAEVAYHQIVLDAIDQTMLPSVRNGEMKSALQGTRSTIAGHLQHAKQLQLSLTGAK